MPMRMLKFEDIIGLPFLANSCGWAMPAINDRLLRKFEHDLKNALFQGLKVTTWQIYPTKTAFEQHISVDHKPAFVVENDMARSVPRGVVNFER